MKNGNRGFSLVELLITSAILAVISGAAVALIYQSQRVYTSQTGVSEAASNVRGAMDQVVRVVRQAGSDPLEMISAPGVAVLGEGHIQINSDLTGSVPSTTGNAMESTGDPDGVLNSIGEVVTFRFDSDTDQLFMNMGYGEAVLSPGISDFSLSCFDAAGNPTSVNDDITVVRINMTGKSENPDQQTGKRNSISLSSDVFIRSKTASPF